MSYLAQVTYTGNGSTTQYSITFPYIDSTHIKAFIDGVQTSAFTVSSSTLTFSSAPANSAIIRIERQTPTDGRIVDFTDGSVLTESDLDKSADQNFFIAQEITDNSLSKLGLDTDDKFDADNKVIKNLANPTNNQDAVTKYYLENTWLSPANKTALTTVNANIANINAVNSNEANINSVNSNETNINTVASNIGSVNTVATDISKVIAVANDLAEAVSEVETVADDLNEATSEIDTVASSISNVDTVGTNIANVNTVAGISSNVTTVAGNNANVSTVAGISGNVTTVAGISSDVTSVANDATDIGTVATDIANVNTVAGISGNVSTVAGISSNVTSVANNSANINSVAGNSTNINTVAGNNSNISTVAGISSNVTSVAGISSDVTAVAGDATDIGTVASNLTGTNTIGTVAGSIANVNNVGGSIANVNTVAGNLSGVNYFGERYRVSATAPTTSLDVGDLYYDTATDAMKVYGSSGWQNAGSSVNGTSQRYNYTATSGQTTFTGSDNNGNTLTYDAGYIDVYLNGVKLLNGTDVTVTSGSSVVLASGATTGDVVDIVAYGTFSVASLNADNLDSGTVPDARITGAYTGITNLTMSGDLTVDTTTLKVDSTNNKVGIGTSSPAKALQIVKSDDYALRVGASDYHWDLGSISGSSPKLNAVGTSTSAIFEINGSEKMRINPSGTLLVGRTGTTATNTGLELEGTGTIISRRNGNVCMFLDRKTSNGTILEFRKDNSTVGNIGAGNGFLYIGKGDTGIGFASDDIIPYNLDTLATRDNGIDLGGSGYRFKDLYLGGGLYVGGTGTANKLDDYEEGTYTAVSTTSTGATVPLRSDIDVISYTKIGRVVHIQGLIRLDTISSLSGAFFQINLPFSTASSSSITLYGGRGGGGISYSDAGTFSVVPFKYSESTTLFQIMKDSATLGTGDDLQISFSYFTD